MMERGRKMVDFAFRLEPYNHGRSVPAAAFARAVEAASEGFQRILNAVAPEIAARHGVSVTDVKDALRLGVCAVTPGSLVLGVEFGTGTGTLPLNHKQIVAAGTKAMRKVVDSGLAGRTAKVGLPATSAKYLAQAAQIAKEQGSARITFARRVTPRRKSASRTAEPQWKPVVNVTKLEPKLRAFAKKALEPKRTQAQIIGRIESLEFDPPGFVISVATQGKLRATMSASLREAARALWGAEALVSVDAAISIDGLFSDVTALAIHPIKPVDLKGFKGTFGAMREAWSGGEAKGYFDDVARERPKS
jgi:hypothetical protein